MKKLVKVEEVEDEGFEGLMGETVTIFCINYIYTGKLVGVNEDFIMLENPSIVYETGAFSDSKWADCQSLETDAFYIQKAAIESFGIIK